MAQMRKSAPPKKTLKPKTALGIVQGKIVRQSTLDQIKKDGMAKAIAKVKSGKATPEYKAGATRMYGVKRTVSGGQAKNLKKPKYNPPYDPTVWDPFIDLAMGGMNKAMTTTGNVVKKAGGAYVDVMKAVYNPKNIKKAIESKGKKSPRLRDNIKKGMK